MVDSAREGVGRWDGEDEQANRVQERETAMW